MKLNVVVGALLLVAALGVGMLAGSVLGAGRASAQVPSALTTARLAAEAPAAPAAQAATTPAPSAPAAPAAPSTAQAKITQQQAEAAALAASPGNSVDHTRLGNENGTLAYDVDFTNGGGVIVDATTGAVIKTEAAGTDMGGHGGRGGGADQTALAAQAKITQQQAEAAALAANAGATVDHSRLGQENGTIFWDVDFTNGGGAKVDATSGAVIASEAAGTDHPGGGRPGGRGGKHSAPPAQTQQP